MPQTAAMIAAQGGHTAAAATDPADAAKEARRRYQEASVEWDRETSQRRRPLYEDVEELISTGFLAHQVTVGSVNLSLRSLANGDRFMLKHRTGPRSSDREWKTWAVATTAWMVDGICLLEEPSAPVQMYRLFKHFPPQVIDDLFTTILGLHNRTSTALLRTEAYCYEAYSRASWRMCGRVVPSLSGVGAIPGSSRLGMNHIQRMWVAFNLSEDDRDVMIRDWAAAKLVASATSPKGIKKLNVADERLRDKEDHRRKAIIEKMVHTVLYGEHAVAEQQMMRVRVQGKIVEVPAVKVARTPEEMQEEFRAWVAGEKDWHDVIVDTYKARIRAKFEDEKNAREELLDDLEREPGVTGSTHMVGYTLEQIQKLRPELAAPTPAARRVFDGSAPSRTYQKWVEPEVSPGRLRADERGVWEAPIERVAPPSLHDQVARRNPTFSGDPDKPIGPPPVEDEG